MKANGNVAPKFSKRHYQVLAEALRDTLLIDCPTAEYLHGARDAFDSAVTRVADALEKDNSRFNRAHFLAVVRGEKSITSGPSRKAVL